MCCLKFEILKNHKPALGEISKIVPSYKNQVEGRGDFNSIRIRKDIVNKLSGNNGDEEFVHDLVIF